MLMTPVPSSMRDVRAAIAERRGKGDERFCSKWCTRIHAPSMPTSSAATARSMVARTESLALRMREPAPLLQCPKDRKPRFFTAGPSLTCKCPWSTLAGAAIIPRARRKGPRARIR